MKLSQVGPVNRFIAKHAVNAKVLGRSKALLCQAVEHAARHRSGVCPKQVLLSLLSSPCVAVASAAIAAVLVDILDSGQVVGGEVGCGGCGWVCGGVQGFAYKASYAITYV